MTRRNFLTPEQRQRSAESARQRNAERDTERRAREAAGETLTPDGWRSTAELDAERARLDAEMFALLGSCRWFGPTNENSN